MVEDTLTHATTVDLEPACRVSAAAFGAKLTVVHPTELRNSITLSQQSLTVGRSPERPEGSIRHGTVSRRHLELEWVGAGGVHLARDLGSHNGSWLDGRPLGDAAQELRDGSVLRLGSVVLVYEILRGPVDGANGAIVGESPAAQELGRRLTQVAADPSPLLVRGETGVGKEHVVRTVHELGRRAGAFVPLNVAELSPQLVESQLFGHVRGAFTGAGAAQRGLFREADRGTLFLDEIGELALDLQPKLLRVIQEGTVRAVGATDQVQVDVRVIAATHRDLQQLVDEGAFRQDLLARLSLLELRVPPLRDRRSDLFLWIERLHQRWCDERSRAYVPLDFDSRAAERLLVSDWPENLRGLDRMVHRMALRESGRPITHRELEDVTDLPAPREARRPAKRPAPQTAQELREALAMHDGSVRATAQWYGRDRRQVYRWMKSFGIDR